MTLTCVAPGWASGTWGTSPWAGPAAFTPGGPIPAVAPFDIFCVEPCGSMSVFLSYDEVDEIATGSQLFVDSNQDQVFTSGGSNPTSDVIVTVTVPIPNIFTADFTIRFGDLPPNFLDLTNSHILINITDASGPCVGLFFSVGGIAYTGGVHFDGGNNLVLDSPVQVLPGSPSFVSEGDYYSYRVVADQTQGLVYIYITQTALLSTIGHQLRFILPIIDAGDLLTPPTDRVLFSVRGTAADASTLSLDTICVGSTALIPNIPPIANAGVDQASRLCSIAQLSGEASFDPEGVTLSYKWRLLDAPLGSSFIFDGNTGNTYPLTVPTGFTDKFHSTELATLNSIDPLIAGEVLVVAGVPYNVTGIGIDGDGFFVQIDDTSLPDSFSSVPFKYVRQRGVSGETTSKPTFLPDVPGIYKFDLIVFDGELESAPSVTIVNVTESPVPRGCTPDLRFVWSYLSDFWRLVEDKERIETFWQASAQMAAAELLALWQIDYSKSLRDVQRTFQRKWLHFDTTAVETLSDQGAITPFFGAVTSAAFVGSTLACVGTQLVLSVGGVSKTVTIAGVDPLPLVDVVAQLNGALRAIDSQFSVTLFTDTALTESFIRITAPFRFVVVGSTTFPGFTAGDTNSGLSGTGTVTGPYTFKTDYSLQGIDLQQGNYLVLDGLAYRIKSVASDTSDAFAKQRIVTLDELPVGPTSWSVPSSYTSKSIDFYNGLVVAGDSLHFEITEDGSSSDVTVPIVGVSATQTGTVFFSSDLLDDFLDSATVVLVSVSRRTYLPIDPLITDIPYLQEHVRETDDTSVLRRNLDFFIVDFRGQSAVRFVADADPGPNVWGYVDPPTRLWAETTYLDNSQVIEQNFGLAVDFSLDDLSLLPTTVDYLSAVRGLWYAYIKGPTIFSLRVGTQILLGLPFAEEAGVITEIRTDFSPTQGRILVQDGQRPEIVRSYTFPLPLSLEVNPTTNAPYVVGDSVAQFAPLVTGAEVKDYINSPSWFQGLMNQGLLFEVEKFFKFLVRVDSAAFNLSALLFVKSFILRVKPTYTYPLFLVLKTIGDTEVSVTDETDVSGTLRLYDGSCFQFNGDSSQGVATMFDEPDPSGGGWQSKFDTDYESTTAPPTFPNADPVYWGYDRYLLCPEDAILGTCTTTFASPTVPTYDNIFAFDNQVFNGTNHITFEDSDITTIPAGPTGIPLYDPITAGFTDTLTGIEVTFDGTKDATGVTYTIDVFVNTVLQGSLTLTPIDGHSSFQGSVSIPIVAGDIVTATIRHSGTSFVSPVWETVLVKIGQFTSWAFDTALPAGTYMVFKDM